MGFEGVKFSIIYERFLYHIFDFNYNMYATDEGMEWMRMWMGVIGLNVHVKGIKKLVVEHDGTRKLGVKVRRTSIYLKHSFG